MSSLLIAHEFQECPGRLCERPPDGVDKSDRALHAKFTDAHFPQRACPNLLLDAHLRQERDP